MTIKRCILLFFIFLALPLYAQDRIYSSFGRALRGYDVVAYFTENKAVKGDSDFKYDYKGAHWYFASLKNKNLFKADPEKYMPQYGGYCAYAMSRGDFVSISPTAFYKVDGKLYLNYSDEIQKKWLVEIKTYINRANSEFKKRESDLL